MQDMVFMSRLSLSTPSSRYCDPRTAKTANFSILLFYSTFEGTGWREVVSEMKVDITKGYLCIKQLRTEG
jgi:hypothetical protein